MGKGKATMKVDMTANNSDLVRKSKESKQALKDFEKVGDDALGRLGEAFGVNTGKIEQMSSALRGLGAKMSESGNAGTAAFGKLLTSVGGLSTAIAGIGIGAVVTGFKLLNEEATAFKNTVQGANIEMATAAYISTYSQALHDANETLGRSTAETWADVSKKWKKFWAEAAFVGVNIISETMESGLDSSGARALDNLYAVRDSAEQQANKAEAYMKRIFNIQRLISDSSVEWKKMEREIAEYKRIAYDKTASTVERQEALAKVTELIRARYEDEAVLRERLANMQAKMNDLTSSSIADIDKANQLRIQADAATENMNNKLREVGELQATLTANAQKEAEAKEAALAAAQAMASSRKALADWRSEAGIAAGNEMLTLSRSNQDFQSRPLIEAAELVKKGWKEAGDEIAAVFSISRKLTDASGKEVEINVTPVLPDGNVMTPEELENYIHEKLEKAVNILNADQLGVVISAEVVADQVETAHAQEAGIAVPVTPVLDAEGVIDVTNELQSVLTSAFDSIGSALGSLIGDLITGEDAWGNFGNAALSAFGDMATSIGKMAISIGVAALAIQGSLTTLNGWAAIAAGTALVALGMAVKTGLSNIASGNYSASASVATSGNYGSSTSALPTSFDEREVNVRVTGNLYASGNQLMAVIENENNRKKHTT